MFALVVLGLVVLGIRWYPEAEAWWCPAVFFGLPLLFAMFYMRHTTKCPQCKKVWVGKRLSDEDLGACSGVFSKKVGDKYHQYEKHKHLKSYQCTACGHEWQKNVTVDKQLD